MNTTTILLFLVMQFIAQYVLYRMTKFIIFKLLGSVLLECECSLKTAAKALSIACLVQNILISFAVLIFTKSGAMSGLSNLMASAALGVVMFIEIKIWQYKHKNYQQER